MLLMKTQMCAMSASSSALKLPPLLLLLLAATGEATTINITNRCSYTVWPAVIPGDVGGAGRALNSGKVLTLDVPAGTTGGRLWARTGCSFSSNGRGSCQTGDCSGALTCSVSGKPPSMLAEFTTGSTQDLFDISVVDGFNVPVDFLPVPVQGEKACSEGPRCAADITSQCPKEVTVPGGCNNTCTGTGSSNCTYSSFFKRMCPDAFTLPDDSATYSCPAGTNYQVIFCPPINLAISPAAMSPPPTLVTTPSPSSPPLAPGYLAPEWLTSQITEKADIYSFGVVVMEVISGRKNIDTSRSEESIHLITLLEEKVKYDSLVDLIDKNSTDMQAPEQDAIQMMKLEMWCLQLDCKKRPKMSEVVKVLEGTMNADTNIDHNFVATSQANFGIAENVNSSAPPIAWEVSGPR